MAYRLDSPDVELAVYGSNLLSAKYIVRQLSAENSQGFTSYTPGMPR